MLIKGIRSFSPENTTPIEFYKPLTLIVGSNGAGKTVRAGCMHHMAAVLHGCAAWLCDMAVLHGTTWVQGQDSQSAWSFVVTSFFKPSHPI